MLENKVSSVERSYLRELAAKYLEYANLPVMKTRTAEWYAHNALKGNRPMVVIETESFEKDFLQPPHCNSPELQYLENYLTSAIDNFELVNDDKVIPAEIRIPWRVMFKLFGHDPEDLIVHSEDASGNNLGYGMKYPITDLEKDFPKLGKSCYGTDKEGTMEILDLYRELVGDIIPVVPWNCNLHWAFALTAQAVLLMGMENLYIAMIDSPELVSAFIKRIADDTLAFANYLYEQDVLTLNNGNHYAGAGSYGFTTELPQKDFTGKIRLKDLWVNMNSQESVGISPELFQSVFYPHYARVASEFGLVYYGCCEPVHACYDNCLENLPNLRKISASRWCDMKFMGERLRNGKVIISRKPDPKFMGIGSLDENECRTHIEDTLHSCEGCKLEFIYRDVYNLNGDRTKPGKIVNIIREACDKLYRD